MAICLSFSAARLFARGRHLSLVTAVGRALELDLPDYTMPKTKNASGYFVADDMDAIELFIGACGTIGVITELEIAPAGGACGRLGRELFL